MEILVSDTAPLTPPRWGGPIRIYNLYKNLTHEITYVGTNCKRGAKLTYKRVTPNLKEISVPISKLYFPIKFIELYFLKHLTFDLFTYIFMYFDFNFKKILNQQKADILISSHVWSFPCFKKRKNQLLIYDSHNCEALLIKDVFKGRFLAKIVAFLVKYIEKKACNKSDLILVCSEKDKRNFMKLYGVNPEKIFLIPNGTNIKKPVTTKVKESLKRELKTSKTVFFIGSFYTPNIEAVRFIIDDLAVKLPEQHFLIAGSVCNAFINKELPKNVKLFGEVDEKTVEQLMCASDVAINPMFKGSGVNIKVLDYFSRGIPVVTTKIGARGIDAQHLKDVIICDTQNFSNWIQKIFDDKKFNKKLSNNGRLIAIKKYDWKKISKKLNMILDKKYKK